MRSGLLPARLLIYTLLAAILAGASCDLPRDPEGTLERVRQTRRVRVGVVDNAPWVMRAENAEPAGVEADLVRELARELNVVPEWSWGGEGRHMEALKNFQLDLVVGGIKRDTAYRHEIALTAPYDTEHSFAAPPGENKWLFFLSEFTRRQQTREGAKP